jgi:transcriptional repressor NrdR
MKCPYCCHRESKVLDSRPTEDDREIRRRRECLNQKCRRRFTTYERYNGSPLLVVKKDQRREPFSSEKLKIGLMKACEKRPLGVGRIRDIVDDIERALRLGTDDEVNSKRIGELVMEHLSREDEIAYIRFASMYKEFKELKDVELFIEEEMLRKKKAG